MKKLQKGDKVAVVAPSGQIGDMQKILAGIEYLKNLGLVPTYGKNLLKQYRYMAGSDLERADDINKAFANHKIKAIFCVRAAAGATRILPYIDYQAAKNNPKPIIGFCDNAALQMALFKKSGIISWNGFLLSYDFKNTLDPKIDADFKSLIAGHKYSITSGKCAVSGKSSGRLICSNLSVLTRLAGTPYFPNLKDKILLIEDRNERLHKVDLMMQQLKQQPNFEKLNGIILGQFTECSGDEEDGTLEDSINDFIAQTNIPVIKDFNFGHTDSHAVLPLGGKVLMDADQCQLHILSN